MTKQCYYNVIKLILEKTPRYTVVVVVVTIISCMDPVTSPMMYSAGTG